jgi:hypothetical protein
MNLPNLLPRGDLTTRLGMMQRELERLQPRRSSGTVTRFGTKGVIRTAIPGQRSTSSSGAAFY